MSRATTFILALLICSASSGFLNGDERVDVGDYAPSYASTKCGGVDDGVAVGKTTCYTCRAGSTPVFYLFVKRQEPGDAVIRLVKQIDVLVGAKQQDGVVGVVNFLGDPKDEKSRARLQKLGESQGLKHVAITVTADGSKFDLDEDDAVTIIMYERGIIRLRSSHQTDNLDAKATETLLRRSKALIE